MAGGGSSIALLARVRDKWELVEGLVESLGGVVDEAWILDDASTEPAPEGLGSGLPLHILRAETWSWSAGAFGEGRQRDRLLQEVKRSSSCRWALQLDADERISDPALLRSLAARPGVDGYVFPLVDFYITADDAAAADARHPERVRTTFGIETRWTLCLYRLRPELYISRGDVREPQGLRCDRVERRCLPLVEHFGKAVSVEECERKVEFYVRHYPAYRSKWEERRGRAVHEGVSDFGSPLLARGEVAYDPRRAPEIHAYACERGWRPAVKRLVLGRLGPLTNRERVARVR